MNTSSRKNLLSQAIADGKAVKETALANAKLAFEEGPVSERNQLTQKQTNALIKLWDKWKHRNTLPRSARSPYRIPYISIERRDDDPTLGNWDWRITYHGEYSDRLVWYSNSKEPMDDVIKTFLRKSYDIEFMSIH